MDESERSGQRGMARDQSPASDASSARNPPPQGSTGEAAGHDSEEDPQISRPDVMKERKEASSSKVNEDESPKCTSFEATNVPADISGSGIRQQPRGATSDMQTTAVEDVGDSNVEPIFAIGEEEKVNTGESRRSTSSVSSNESLDWSECSESEISEQSPLPRGATRGMVFFDLGEDNSDYKPDLIFAKCEEEKGNNGESPRSTSSVSSNESSDWSDISEQPPLPRGATRGTMFELGEDDSDYKLEPIITKSEEVKVNKGESRRSTSSLSSNESSNLSDISEPSPPDGPMEPLVG